MESFNQVRGDEMQPLVSVNIPTYNSEKTLDETLRSVVNQTYPNIEIIVVDGESGDGTVEVARRCNCELYYARAMCKARKLGVEKSKGRYIFLLDSDQSIPPDTIEKCVLECEQGEYNTLTLFEQSIIEKGTFIEKVIAYDKWLFHSLEDDDVIHGSAIPRFFQANLLRNIELPDELFGFEHNFIHHEVMKQGAKVKFMSDLYIYHHEQNTLIKIFKRFYHYGHGYIPALRQDRKLVAFHSLPRRAYFTKKAWSRPLLLFGLFFLYFIKAVAAAMGATAYLLRGGKYEREVANG